MIRKDMLTILRQILKVLSNDKEYSIKAISEKINSRWETTLNALEFLKEVGLIKERFGETRYRTERLFRIQHVV